MEPLKLYRRRYIPDEIVYLKDDELVQADGEKIITRWKVLKKRPDFTHGVSCIFLKEGFKISKFINKDEKMLFWYCDIVNCDYNEKENSYIINDLLIDIVIQNNGNIKVLDMNEIAEALEKNIITQKMACEALTKADCLLNIIYNGKFGEYAKYIENIY